MRVFIAFCTLFSLVLAASVKQNLDDCPPGESSGYGDPLPIGIPNIPTTPTSSSMIPESSSTPDDSDPGSSCQSGSATCCNSVYSHDHKEARDLLGRVDANFARQLPNIPDFSFMGLGCVPIPVEGMGSVSWWEAELYLSWMILVTW